MKKYKKLLMGGVFLLLSILVIGCKKDDPEPTPPVKEPELVLKQVDGKVMASGAILNLVVGQTETLTVEGVPNLQVTTQGNAVSVVQSQDKKTLIVTPKEEGTATVTITYGNNKKLSFTVKIAKKTQENPTGLFKNGNLMVPFGYVARKSHQLWATDQATNLQQKYIKVVSQTGPIQSLPIGAKVKVSSTGLSNGVAFSETEFTLVKGKDNFVTFESSDHSYKIVVLN